MLFIGYELPVTQKDVRDCPGLTYALVLRILPSFLFFRNFLFTVACVPAALVGLTTKCGFWLFFTPTYRIYLIKRLGHLLNFWTLRVGAYLRWAFI